MPLSKDQKEKLKKAITKLPAPKKGKKPEKLSITAAPGGPRPKNKEEYKKLLASRDK